MLHVVLVVLHIMHMAPPSVVSSSHEVSVVALFVTKLAGTHVVGVKVAGCQTSASQTFGVKVPLQWAAVKAPFVVPFHGLEQFPLLMHVALSL
jgi:hypothetical protein